MNTQLKKGVLDLCVLALLQRKDCYGYELVQEVSRTVTVAEGTIYPLLHRLKKENYVTTYLKESNEGAPRKYYKLTAEGKKELKKQHKDWKELSKKVLALIGEK
jgi:PadR family transcriptional regulator PadR